MSQEGRYMLDFPLIFPFFHYGKLYLEFWVRLEDWGIACFFYPRERALLRKPRALSSFSLLWNATIQLYIQMLSFVVCFSIVYLI